jgi:hypothetical protein
MALPFLDHQNRPIRGFVGVALLARRLLQTPEMPKFPVGWEGPVFLTRSCRLALDGMSGGVKLTDDYSFTWFFTTERSESP